MTDFGLTAAELTLFMKMGVKGTKCSCGKKFRNEKDFVEHLIESQKAVVRAEAHRDNILEQVKSTTHDIVKALKPGEIQP